MVESDDSFMISVLPGVVTLVTTFPISSGHNPLGNSAIAINCDKSTIKNPSFLQFSTSPT